ncbi:hypothetical protein ANO14919_138760 [Xylariales sp. No.14919]|nr:hypothetical protein F5X98DRAFT_276615 [Xylaria grammica]GAW24292.1 hypothetical protein ANO14919_138760 [Xylariales sp. No.14919]
MAPVTRRAAKAQGDSPIEESTNATSATKKEISFEEPIALRNKRKPSSNVDGQTDDVNSAKLATPKRKNLEVRIREDGASAKSSIEVQIPSSTAKTPRSRSSPVPDSQETDTCDRTFEPLSASKQLEEEAAQQLASQSRLSDSGPESTPMPKTTKSTRARFAGKGREESIPKAQSLSQPIDSEADTKATPLSKAAKSSHVVFGDDDDVDKFVAAATEKDGPSEAGGGNRGEEEQEDSDDEAPEAVSTAAAAKETLKSARAAIEAAEKFAATTKRKRQARDDLLKQQAEKRKRTKSSVSGNEDSSENEDEERNTTSKRQRRTQKLPNLLPAEFLTDSSEDEEDGTALNRMAKKPKKITFETAMHIIGAEGKGPRDEVVGSTRYRILTQQSDQRLAPKANENSRKSKEALLRRGRAPVASNKKRGFFIK